MPNNADFGGVLVSGARGLSSNGTENLHKGLGASGLQLIHGGGGRIPQGPEFSSGNGVRQGEGVSPKHINVLEAERREARDILGKNFVAFRAEVIECGVHIDCVPQNYEVDDDAECAELVFLPFAVSLSEFASLSMEDDAGELMASLATVELNQNAPTVLFVVDVAQQIESLDEAAEFLKPPRQPGWPVVGLKGSCKPCRLNHPQLQ